jgi:hypothetical protein
MFRFRHTLIAAALAAAAPAFGATPIDETRPLDARGRVEIENLKGRIEVRAWNRNEVKVTGSLGDGVERLIVEGGGANVRIEARYPERNWGRGNSRSGPTTLIVQVPLQASLDIESVSAHVHVEGVAPPELEIESVSGDVVFAGAPGRADIETVSGSQTLTVNSAGEVSADSVSGEIVLRGRLSGRVDAQTVSGNVQVDSRGEALRGFSAESVSGDVTARIGLANGGEVRGETVSGDFDLHLPRALSARVEAESFSGTLRAPGAKVDKEEFGPGSSLRTRYGSGAGEIRVETFSGDFTLSLD